MVPYGVEMFSIDKEKANRLLKAGKKHTNGGAKLNSVFITAIGLAIKRLYHSNQIEDKKSLLFETAINNRKIFGLEDTQLACYVTVLFGKLHLDELSMETFWNVAEEKSKFLHRLLGSFDEIGRMYQDMVGSLDNEAGDYENQVNLCTSNLGIMTNSSGVLKVEREYLVAKVPLNYGMYFSIVTIDGTQHWTVVHNKSIVSSSTVLLFIKEYNQVIEDLINDI